MGHGLLRGFLLPSPAPPKHILSDKSRRPSVFTQRDFVILSVLHGSSECCGSILRNPLPHALRGAVAVVPIQLWHTQHGLGQHGQEA